jgi:hypothetical protein
VRADVNTHSTETVEEAKNMEEPQAQPEFLTAINLNRRAPAEKSCLARGNMVRFPGFV